MAGSIDKPTYADYTNFLSHYASVNKSKSNEPTSQAPAERVPLKSELTININGLCVNPTTCDETDSTPVIMSTLAAPPPPPPMPSLAQVKLPVYAGTKIRASPGGNAVVNNKQDNKHVNPCFLEELVKSRPSLRKTGGSEPKNFVRHNTMPVRKKAEAVNFTPLNMLAPQKSPFPQKNSEQNVAITWQNSEQKLPVSSHNSQQRSPPFRQNLGQPAAFNTLPKRSDLRNDVPKKAASVKIPSCFQTSQQNEPAQHKKPTKKTVTTQIHLVPQNKTATHRENISVAKQVNRKNVPAPNFINSTSDPMPNVKTVIPVADENAEVDKSNPKVKKLVYNTYRDFLGAYNNKANNIIGTLPRSMVVQDQGVLEQVEIISSQGCLDKINGRVNPHPDSD